MDRPPAKPRAQDQDERNSGKRLRLQKGSCKKTQQQRRLCNEEEDCVKTTQEPRRLLKVRPVRPFVARDSAPLLRPVLCSTSLRGVSRKLSKGGVPPLRPPHAVHPPIGSELPHPFPSHQARRDSGGSSRRGDSGGRFPFRPPQEPLVQQSCVPHPSRRDRYRVVRGGRRS